MGAEYEELKTEISNLKDTARFFIKINLGALAALFAFISFVSETPNEAIGLALRIRILIGVLVLMLGLGFYCEYILVLGKKKDKLVDSLAWRATEARMWLQMYVGLWIAPILIVFSLILGVDVVIMEDARI